MTLKGERIVELFGAPKEPWQMFPQGGSSAWDEVIDLILQLERQGDMAEPAKWRHVTTTHKTYDEQGNEKKVKRFHLELRGANGELVMRTEDYNQTGTAEDAFDIVLDSLGIPMEYKDGTRDRLEYVDAQA